MDTSLLSLRRSWKSEKIWKIPKSCGVQNIYLFAASMAILWQWLCWVKVLVTNHQSLFLMDQKCYGQWHKLHLFLPTLSVHSYIAGRTTSGVTLELSWCVVIGEVILSMRLLQAMATCIEYQRQETLIRSCHSLHEITVIVLRSWSGDWDNKSCPQQVI